MLALRPMVVDADGVILGGNMRYKALQHLGFKDIPDEWVRRADELTEDERRRFIIADNVSGGEWDVEDLAANWDREELSDWGVELEWGVDYSEKNTEIDTSFEDQKYTFKLEYSETEYIELKEKLQQISKTPEAIFYDALISI